MNALSRLNLARTRGVKLATDTWINTTERSLDSSADLTGEKDWVQPAENSGL